MKIQVRRNIFETNSSSTHTLSIIKEDKDIEYPESVVFTTGKFGWEEETYTETYSKASYLWEIICFAGNIYREHCPETKFLTYEEYIQRVKDILDRHNIKYEFEYGTVIEKTSTYEDETFTYNEYVNQYGDVDNGYIDHVSECEDFINFVTSKDEYLLNFLFSDKSYIVTGNDNTYDDEELECPDFGEAYEFYKGN